MQEDDPNGDLALARQLQEEEDRAYAAALTASEQAGGARGPQQFKGRIEGQLGTVLSYEDPLLQARALSCIPLEQLQGEAEREVAAREVVGPSAGAGGGGGAPARDDEVADAAVRALLRWFKRDFFSWVNCLPCSACGSSKTRADGAAPPTDQEAAGQAQRVELHRCTECNAVTRFPRYNDPGTLLETRRGRCGEWANAFTLCCRAMQRDARLVLDWTDHVWTEVYSPALGRWVHCDACENSWDKPLLYEGGWKKKLTYVMGIGCTGVADVTLRYTRDWANVLPRRTEIPEGEVGPALQVITARLRAALPEPERRQLAARDTAEAAQLAAAQVAEVGAGEQLPGRESGSVEWRSQRGEIGSGAAAEASTAPALVTPTDSTGCPEVVVRASGENLGGLELAANLLQEKGKWLDFGAGKLAKEGAEVVAWVEVRFADRQARAVSAYSLSSANDCPERDPKDFTFEGLAPGATSWEVLDRRVGVYFMGRHEHRTFAATERPCLAYRLCIRRLRDPARANCVQLARLQLTVAQDLPDEEQDALRAHVEAVLRAPNSAAAVSTVGKILRNLCGAAGTVETKHRRLRMQNERVQAAVVASGGIAVLQMAGFEVVMASPPPPPGAPQNTPRGAPEPWLVFQDTSPPKLAKVGAILRTMERMVDPSKSVPAGATCSVPPAAAGPSSPASAASAPAPTPAGAASAPSPPAAAAASADPPTEPSTAPSTAAAPGAGDGAAATAPSTGGAQGAASTTTEPSNAATPAKGAAKADGPVGSPGAASPGTPTPDQIRAMVKDEYVRIVAESGNAMPANEAAAKALRVVQDRLKAQDASHKS